MGCGASAGKGKKTEVKDPEDGALDDIEMQETGIADYDSAFGKGGDALNKVVALNNLFIDGVDLVKSTAGILIGCYVAEVTFNGKVGTFTVKANPYDAGFSGAIVTAPGGAKATLKIENKEHYDKLFVANAKTGKDALKALETTNVVLGKLNKALEAAGPVSVVSNRLQCGGDAAWKKKGDPKIGQAKALIDDFNTAYFKLKNNMIKASLGSNMKEVCGEILKGVKEAGGAPAVKSDVSGIANGTISFEAVLDQAVIDKLPQKFKDAWANILELIEIIKKAAAELAELKPAIEEAVAAILALPKDPSEIKTAATGAGLGGMDALKVPGKMASNVKEAGKAPEIMKAFLANLENTVKDITAALAP